VSLQRLCEGGDTCTCTQVQVRISFKMITVYDNNEMLRADFYSLHNDGIRGPQHDTFGSMME